MKEKKEHPDNCRGCQLACICIAYEDLGGCSEYTTDPNIWKEPWKYYEND